MQVLETKNKYRIAGILIFLLAFFLVRASFLEHFSFISEDGSITFTASLILIDFCRIFLLILAMLIFFYPFLERVYKKLGLKANAFFFRYKENKVIATSMKIIIIGSILFLLFSFYLMFMVIDKMYFYHKYLPPDNYSFEVFFKEITAIFTDSYKLMKILLLTEDIERKEIDIPIYDLYVPQKNLMTLNSNLPESGFSYVNGNFTFENKTYEVKVRYRGDLAHHWAFTKKSWRINLKDKQLLNFSNKFNIISPEAPSMMDTFLLGYYIAENIGLMTPRSQHVALFLNNKYAGIYQYSDQIDETFLRARGKLPGDIFYGDVSYNHTKVIKNPDTWYDADLYYDPMLWDIAATYDGDEERARQYLSYFINSITSLPLQGKKQIYDFFTVYTGDEFIKFYAYTIFIGSNHVDLYHNHKLYFNPSSGQFEPIVWDEVPFGPTGVDFPIENNYNVPFIQIIYNPLFVHKKNLYLKEFMEKISEEMLFKFIDEAASKIKYEEEHDKYKITLREFSTVLSNEDWDETREVLKEQITKRYTFLRKELEKANLTTYIINNTNNTALIFEVQGVSAVNITIKIKAKAEESCVAMYKDKAFNYKINETYYFGTFCSEKDDSITIPLETLYPSALHSVDETQSGILRYVYFFETKEEFEIEAIDVKNAVTWSSVNATILPLQTFEELFVQSPLENRFASRSANELHPWEIEEHNPETVIFNGTITLTENVVLQKGDTLIIQPGTTILFAQNISIISYGKILAEGTKEAPITFASLTEEPWGVLALQGAGANGSSFSYCIFDGGSGAEYQLVTYTGMLSAYNTPITIDNCTFQDNQIYDDAFNAKYSFVQITNSTFSNIFSDAVDIDISEGIIEQNSFTNIGGDAIDLMTSKILVKDNKVINAHDKGISIGEMSTPLIINNTIMSSITGIAIKDNSDAILINNTLISNSIGLAAYEKNWKYGGGGKGIVQGTDLCQNTEPLLIQNSSIIKIEQEGLFIECTEKECLFSCG